MCQPRPFNKSHRLPLDGRLELKECLSLLWLSHRCICTLSFSLSPSRVTFSDHKRRRSFLIPFSNKTVPFSWTLFSSPSFFSISVWTLAFITSLLLRCKQVKVVKKAKRTLRHLCLSLNCHRFQLFNVYKPSFQWLNLMPFLPLPLPTSCNPTSTFFNKN